MKTHLKKVIHYGFLVLVFFTPLIFLPQVCNLYTLPKECFIRVVVSLLLISWAIENISSRKWEIRFSPLGLPILLYFLAFSISLLLAVNPYTGAYEILRRVTYILFFFLVINHVRDERVISNICGAAVTAGLLVSLVGIFQYFTPLNPDWLYQVYRPSATFGNKNMAAQYVIMVIPLSFALFLHTRDERIKLFWAVAAIEMVAYVIYTHSRGAWIGLALGGLFCFFLLVKGKWPALYWGLSKKRASLLILLLSIHIILPQIIPIPTKLHIEYSRRVTTMMELDSGSVRSRIAVWANTLDLIRDHPIGIGINNWKVIYPKYTHSRMVDKATTSEKYFEDAHNDYLQMISEIGVVGFAFYLWILALLLRICWKSLDLKYTPFFLWSIAAYMTTSLFSFPLKMPATSLFFWLLAGLIVVNRFGIADGGLRIDTSTEISKPVIRIFIGFSIIWLAFTILFSFFQIVSDYHFKRAYFLEDRGKLEESLKGYTRSVQHNPFGYRSLFCRGRVFFKMNRFNESVKDNLSALKLYPHDLNTHGNLGLAYSAQCLFELAEKEYKEVLRLYPEDSRSPKLLRELEVKKDLYANSKADYERSLATAPDSAETYYHKGYLYLLCGSLDEAVSLFNKAIQTDSRLIEAHYNLAKAYFKKRRFDEAIEAYEETIKINPGLVKAYRDLGKVYEEKRLFKDAMKAYWGALSVKPNDADTHLDLAGLFLRRLPDKKLAIFHLRKTLELNPNHPRAKKIKETIKLLSD